MFHKNQTTMKRATIFAMALMLGFASCSKESTEGVGPENLDGAALSFSFQRPGQKYVTYADIATAAEWEINTLDIYYFEGTTYKGKLASTDYTESEDAATHTTTIAMTKDWVTANVGKTYTFYFAANDVAGEATNAPHIPGAFAGNLDAFKALPTNVLTDTDADTKFDNIETSLLFSGVSAPVAVTGGKISQSVTLKRRVARFDIVNPKPYQYRVTEIYVSDVKVQGAMFAAGSGMAPIATRSLDKIVGPLPGDYDGTRAACVFYLYPTELEDETIALEVEYIGEADGEKEIFTLADDTHVSIDANKRYTLTLNAADLTFTVGTDEYDEGII